MNPEIPSGGRVALSLPWGDGVLPLHVPRGHLLGVVCPAGDVGPQPADEQAVIAATLAAPIGTASLAELARGSAAMVVSDVTRPCPGYKFLPALLRELEGIPDERITVMCALGGHRKQSDDELRQLVGHAVLRCVPVLDLDGNDCVTLGTTSAGTPVGTTWPRLVRSS